MQQTFPQKIRASLTTKHVYWYWLLAGIALVVLLLGLYNQPYYPRTWIDEGFVLQGAVNLTEHGLYGMQSVEGMRILDQPLIANGPGVVLPITAMFMVFGIGLLQARLVAVLFMILTAILYLEVARKLYGKGAALVSMLLLLAVPIEGYLLYGRHALGNVPALGYFLLGYLLWLIALKRERFIWPVAAGLLFGLASTTKGQYILLIPAWLALLVADLVYYKRIGVKKIITVLISLTACLVAWYAVQILLVGSENVAAHFNSIQSSSAVTVMAFELQRIPGSVAYLFTSGFVLFVVPGLLYVTWTSRKSSQATARQLLLIILVAGWTVWYVLISVGWHRYLFTPYALGLLFTGKAVADSIAYLRLHKGAISDRSSAAVKNIILAGFVGLVLIGSFVSLGRHIMTIATTIDKSAQLFATYLQQTIPSNAVIESWEWELDALTELTYHHPTNEWVDRLTAVTQFNVPLEETYNLYANDPDYLIDGQFSKWTGLYRPALQDGCCILINSIGSYDLYEVQSP